MNPRILLFFFLLFCTCSVQAQQQSKLDSLGLHLEELILEGNYEAFDSLFAWKSLFYDVVNESMNIEDNSPVMQMALERIKISNLLREQITQYNGQFSFLNAYQAEGKGHLVFRIYSDTGLNYHIYQITWEDDLTITDLFPVGTGELFSVTIKRLFTEINGMREAGVSASVFRENTNRLKDIRTLVEEGNYERADSVFSTIPKFIRNEKIFTLVELRVKSGLSDEKYAEALSAYLERFPNDPSVYLRSLDYLSISEKYDELFVAIDQLDSLIKGDPLLDMYRGEAYYQKGQIPQARTYYEKVTKDLPYILDGQYLLLDLYVELKEFEKSIKVLDDIEANFWIDPMDLVNYIEEESFYEQFVKTERFKKWRVGANKRSEEEWK